MNCVTLNHINRVGMDNWKARKWWGRQRVQIWSKEHLAWWRPDACGYTTQPNEAWVLPFSEAYERTKHCGPEKAIVFYAFN
jgi:hypothetical protein